MKARTQGRVAAYQSPCALYATTFTPAEVEEIASAVAAGAVAFFPADPIRRLACTGDLLSDEIAEYPILRAVAARLPSHLELATTVWADCSALATAEPVRR